MSNENDDIIKVDIISNGMEKTIELSLNRIIISMIKNHIINEHNFDDINFDDIEISWIPLNNDKEIDRLSKAVKKLNEELDKIK